VKLWLLMTPLCFTFFLVLLDISIIATVGPPPIPPFNDLQLLTQ
jgi:hypothetical protein